MFPQPQNHNETQKEYEKQDVEEHKIESVSQNMEEDREKYREGDATKHIYHLDKEKEYKGESDQDLFFGNRGLC